MMVLFLDRNLLECVPDWACEAKKLEILDMSYNLLTEVPARYAYTDAYLTYVFKYFSQFGFPFICC